MPSPISPKRSRRRRRIRPKNVSVPGISWAAVAFLFVFDPSSITTLNRLARRNNNVFWCAQAAVICSTNKDCRALIHPSSKCNSKSWTCTNPFASGCLRTLLGPETFPNRRVCNSDDGPSPDAALCDVPDPNFNYTEVRIAPGNWESAMFNAYILQILLSELLGVPCTLETGDDIVLSEDGQIPQPGRLMSFYDADNGFPYPSKAYQFESLEVANDHGGDCIAAGRSGVGEVNGPKPCAHLIPEVWAGQKKKMDDVLRRGVIDPVVGNGMVGKMGWYIPAFLVREMPELAHYFGLQGQSNRRKLAEVFKRPTTWAEYCQQVSPTNCTAKNDDAVATRPPKDGEGSLYYSEGVYKGHFRANEKNDCDAHPDSCTGHIVNCPCTWSTNVDAQLYHNDIALESNGREEPNGGYSYGEMVQIWNAAEATRSPVIMWWWRPGDPLFQKFRGRPGQFEPITLPETTAACTEGAVSGEERCDADPMLRVGNPIGACGQGPETLHKLVASSLGQEAADTLQAIRSAAHETLTRFRITDLEIDALVDTWLERGIDTWGYDSRDAVCHWVADNIEFLQSFVPNGYPRHIQTNYWYGPLTKSGLVVGCVAIVFVLMTASAIFYWRDEKAMIYAQLNFIYLIVSGFFLVSVGAVIYALEPTDSRCNAKEWLVTLGYTLGIVPLLVKVAAINRIMSNAKKNRRVKIDPKNLMRIVFGVTFAVTIFLILWTSVDNSCVTKSLDLVEESGQAVRLSYSCQSHSYGWKIAALAWEFFLLLCASVLAFQTRKVEQLFSESTYLSMLVYCHFFFAVLRAITCFLDSMPSNLKAGTVSLLLSFDTIISIVIYFGKKFWCAYHHEDPSITRGPTAGSRLSDTSSFIRSAHNHHQQQQQQQDRVVSFCLNDNVDSDDDPSVSHQRRRSTDLNSVGSRSHNGDSGDLADPKKESKIIENNDDDDDDSFQEEKKACNGGDK